jgi:polyhydroxybutyrate depolymerase
MRDRAERRNEQAGESRRDRERSRRTGRRGALALAGVVALVATACVPPPSPPPSVLPQPPGRGIDPSTVVAPSAGCSNGPGLAPGRSTVSIAWQGLARRALVDVPSVAPYAAPVLVSLHPFSVGPEGWEGYSNLALRAAERGYVVVTPLGSDPGPRWAVPGGLATGIDDIGFINRLLDDLEDRGCVDRNRQFAAGFSAGAAMAQALSCTVPWRFRAVAGSGGTNLTDLCPDSPATDVMILHGTADPIAPLTGSEVVFAPPLGLPVSAVVATDADRAGCDPVPVVDQRAPTVQVSTFTGCGEHRVEYWSLQGSGHTWAGTRTFLDLFAGPTNTDVSATEVVLDFFDATPA